MLLLASRAVTLILNEVPAVWVPMEPPAADSTKKLVKGPGSIVTLPLFPVFVPDVAVKVPVPLLPVYFMPSAVRSATPEVKSAKRFIVAPE